MPEELIVGMGRYMVSDKEVILASMSLGSCVGVTLFDSEKRMGAMAHVMLPRAWKTGLRSEYNTFKFADVVILKMVEELLKLGCSLPKMTAKIAGGAHMFPGISEAEIMDVGKQNVDVVTEELKRFGIRLVASETGGHIGRTVRFNTYTGEVTVKTKDCTRAL
jgi:chemotaxis protein CheD